MVGKVLASVLVLASLFSLTAARASDGSGALPAISGWNGKLQFEGGPDTIMGFSNPESFEWRAGGSLSIPLDTRFGLQADIAASNSITGSEYGGGIVHFFTRDPNSYLFGVTGGAFFTDHGSGEVIGPEIEYYNGPIYVSAYGGYMNLNVTAIPSSQLFGIADVTYFAHENLGLNLGIKDIAGFKTAHAGIEYQFSDMSPMAVTLDGKIGDADYKAVNLGIKLYLGSAPKSLQRRHREDDPPNRIFDIFSGAGSAFSSPGMAPGCGPNEIDVDQGPGVHCVTIEG